jgi:hypothetical protein
MLAYDRIKANPPQLLSRNQAAPYAGFRAYKSARPGLAQYHQMAHYCGLSGLGLNTETLYQANQFNFEPISRAALTVIQSIEGFFKLGAGRKEADQIVPMQNQIHYDVLAPIAEAVNAPFRFDLCQSQLQQMLDALIATEEAWLQFLHNTTWSDGRAAEQAEATLEFLFYDQEQKLRDLLVDAPWECPLDVQEITPVTGTTGGARYGTGGSTTVVRETAGSGITSIGPLALLGGALFLLPKLLR